MLNTDAPDEVMRGHVEECLEHLQKRFNSKIKRRSPGRLEALKPLIDFCQISQATASKLMDIDKDPDPPKGRILIKLICYLNFHGYRVIEFERTQPVLRNFAELIGYGVLSADEAFRLVGYHDSQQIYQVIWEREGLSKEKEAKIWEIWKGRRDELEQKKRNAFKDYNLQILFKTDSSVDYVEQQALLPLDLAGGDVSRRLALINILKGTLGLFDSGLFNDLSSNEINDLKQYGRMIHRLNIHLSNLSLKINAPEEE